VNTYLSTTDNDAGHPGLEQLRATFQTEHPFCAAAEVWHDIDGEPTLLRIECGTPTEHPARLRRV
jgi:hypothetical protein